MTKKYEATVYYQSDEGETCTIKNVNVEQLIDSIDARLVPFVYTVDGARYITLINADKIREIDIKLVDSEEDK
ncbi:hypothetical protein MFLO_16000 [Listeria floridensis FSL S10-1187]|uniref:Uncharacterized protein n=1 Tax=Listeria floridensis FSL S10-1187 TaxID=1265817 RepID=A0ABN0RB31_9LIST|nr:hypothetical protein [Listeria floridensis]EUJ23365.1 hypothetical protein MFLO_16000 [Listeria floridensis FSL S10-1187]